MNTRATKRNTNTTNNEDNKAICTICGKRYKQRKSLYEHTRNVHKKNTVNMLVSKRQIKCPICNKTENNREKVCAHLTAVHNFPIHFEKKTFKKIEEFKEWKDEIEANSMSQYVLERGSKRMADESKKLYYHCSRSGDYEKDKCVKSNRKNQTQILTDNEKNTRRTQSQGISKRIGKLCPATMEIRVFPDDHVELSFWSTHVGHDPDSEHCSNSSKMGHSSEDKSSRILDYIRDSVSTDTENFSQVQLRTEKVLNNLQNQIPSAVKFKTHQNDAISVSAWVKSVSRLGLDSPVIYVKNQGTPDPMNILSEEDTCVVVMTKFQAEVVEYFENEKICIDVIHGRSAHDFEINTLLTIDEFGAGCPVAYCFSNRKVDQKVIEVFLDALKRKSGIIRASVFISGDTPVYYNAWRSVMGQVEKRLLCSWHVDKSWRQALKTISGKEDNKIQVYKTLRMLLQEPSVEKFHPMLGAFIKQLLEDADTVEFGKYFETLYACRPEMWALCYRIGLGINTHMHVETIHRTMIHLYLEGKKAKRLDKSINALLTFTRDKVFDRLKFSQETSSYRILKIRSSHNEALVMAKSTVTKISDHEWNVQPNYRGSYKIIKLQNPSCSNQCKYICHSCRKCLHMYTCTCPEFVACGNMCQHVHYCIIYKDIISSRLTPNDENLKIEEDSSDITITEHLLDDTIDDSLNSAENENTVNSDSTLQDEMNEQAQYILGPCSESIVDNEIVVDNNSALQDEMKKKAQHVLGLCLKNVDDETCRSVIDHLDQIRELLS